MFRTLPFSKKISLNKALALALSVFFYFSAASQVSYLGSTSSSVPGNNSKKLIFQHTVTASANFLVVTVTTQDKSIVSVKYGQQLLTAAAAVVNKSMWVAVYYLANPAAGTDAVTVETSASTDIAAGASNYGNVYTSNPIAQTATNSGKSASPNITINSSNGDLVIDAIGMIGGSLGNPIAQLLGFKQSASHPNGSSYKTVVASSTTTSWNIPGNTDWGMAGILIKAIPAAAPLPIKLSSFTAMLGNNKVDLNWTTSTEINASHFVIEKSLDGRNYSQAGIVFAFGNTTTDMHYTYADNLGNSNATVIYYRLRSVDTDGKSAYSDVRVIRINKTTDQTITILTYPNPVSSELRITIPANWQNKKVIYELFSANGLTAKKTESSNASQTENINVAGLSAGFYIVRVSCEGTTVQQTIVKN